jgi:hypothetical protein
VEFFRPFFWLYKKFIGPIYFIESVYAYVIFRFFNYSYITSQIFGRYNYWNEYAKNLICVIY